MLLATGSLTASASCALPPFAFVTLAAAIILFAAHALIVAGRGGRVDLSRGATWRLEGFGQTPFEGCPVAEGYRGSAALVLVLERTGAQCADERCSTLARLLDRRRRRRRLVVHVDSVSTSDFSLLHLHLALPAGTTA